MSRPSGSLGIIALTNPGAELARKVAGAVSGSVLYLKPEHLKVSLAPGGPADSGSGSAAAASRVAESPMEGRLCDFAGRIWQRHGCLLFIMALGIVVREISAHVKSKKSDPAVVVMDDAGRSVISVLSGHIGGANRWCRFIASVAGASPVITTSTDLRGIPAFDSIAHDNNMLVEDDRALQRISLALIEGRTVAMLSDVPVRVTLPPNIRVVMSVDEAIDGAEDLVFISHRDLKLAGSPGTRLVIRPRNLAVGVGMKKGVSRQDLEAAILRLFEQHGLSTHSIAHLATIDLKAGEPGLLELSQAWGVPVKVVPRSEIARWESRFEQSEFVKRQVGIGAVAEPSAVLSLVDPELIAAKTSYRGITLAVALERMFAVRSG